jgi:hypothetical protein
MVNGSAKVVPAARRASYGGRTMRSVNVLIVRRGEAQQ